MTGGHHHGQDRGIHSEATIRHHHHHHHRHESKKKDPPVQFPAEGLLKVALMLPAREGVRLCEVTKSWSRLQRLCLSNQLRIVSSDLVPSGPEQKELMPEALKHLGHCWGAWLLVLDLSGCDFLVDSVILNLMSAYWATILELKLRGCRLLTDASVKAVTESCRNLKDLDISGLELITASSVHHVVTNCASIEQIHLADCLSMPDEALEILSTSCRRLGLLNISNNPLVTDAGLAAIAVGCLGLHTLDLGGCKHVTDHGLQIIASGFSELTEVSFNELNDWVTEVGMRSIIDVSSKLNVLRMRKMASDNCLAVAACRCNQLRELDISDCPAVTDVGLQLVSNCRYIEIFRAENCTSLTDTGVQSLALGCPFLRLASLSGCIAVTDIGISGFGDMCQKLEHLDLCRCHVGDRGMFSLVPTARLPCRGCPLLREIVLSWTAVTDAGVEALAACCPQLEEINLFQTRVSDIGLRALVEGCPLLQKLNIASCFNVTQDGIALVGHLLPQVQILQRRGAQRARAQEQIRQAEEELAEKAIEHTLEMVVEESVDAAEAAYAANEAAYEAKLAEERRQREEADEEDDDE